MCYNGNSLLCSYLVSLLLGEPFKQLVAPWQMGNHLGTLPENTENESINTKRGEEATFFLHILANTAKSVLWTTLGNRHERCDRWATHCWCNAFYCHLKVPKTSQ